MSILYNFNFPQVEEERLQHWTTGSTPIASAEPCLIPFGDPLLSESNSHRFYLPAHNPNDNSISSALAIAPTSGFPQVTASDNFDFSWLDGISKEGYAQGQTNTVPYIYSETQMLNNSMNYT